MPGLSKRVKKHLCESELDESIDEAQSNEETRLVRRLYPIEPLYAGESVTDAASRVGVTQPTASRWTDRWNEHGLDGLGPDFGGSRPPKTLRARTEPTYRGSQTPSATHHRRRSPAHRRRVRRIILENILTTKPQKYEIRYAVPRPGSHDRPDDAEDRLQKRFEAALDELGDDAVTDGGVVVGFSTKPGLAQPTSAGGRGPS